MYGLTPATAVFTILSFEGPDEYARAGGLAVRVRDLSRALAAAGFETHLFFVGDPDLPGVERHGNLTLHRWCQWISAFHRGGVYDGEWGKQQDMIGSLPPFLLDAVVGPAQTQGKVTVVMGEDWQIAPVMIALQAVLEPGGLAAALLPVWTANNLYGFWTLDAPALRSAAGVLTVSRYMKFRMAAYGFDALVTPNGIAPTAIVAVDTSTADELRAAFQCDLALFKIGRFTPDKGWVEALEAVAALSASGIKTRLLLRGDRSPYGLEVLARARTLGLTVGQLSARYRSIAELSGAIAAQPETAVLVLTSFLPDQLLPVIYAAADAVLANSSFEPFGLVGLEVMGAGGLAVVGSTGEDYARPGENAVVLDTNDPGELVVALRRLSAQPEERTALREAGKRTAAAYLWPAVFGELFARLEYVAFSRGVEVGG